MNANGLKDAAIDGFDEAGAVVLFASDARFMLQCQMASIIIDALLAGVLFMQVTRYFSYQSDDKWWTKLIVAWCSLWAFIITIYYWIYISYLFIDSYGKWLPWLEVRWLARMPAFDVMCVSAVQGSFAYRAFLLTRRNWYILGITSLLILGAFGGGIGLAVQFGSQRSLLGAANCGPTLISWNALNCAADIVIAACILWGVLKSKSGWAHTDRLISRLILMTFEAQLPPTFLALALSLNGVTQTPSSLLGAVFQALESKAYTVGLLFTLNARISFTVNTTDTKSGIAPQVYAMSDRRPTQLEVTVHNETFVHDDYNNQSSQAKIDKSDSFSDFSDGRHVINENGSQARLTHPESFV